MELMYVLLMVLLTTGNVAHRAVAVCKVVDLLCIGVMCSRFVLESCTQT